MNNRHYEEHLEETPNQRKMHHTQKYNSSYEAWKLVFMKYVVKTAKSVQPLIKMTISDLKNTLYE